MNTRFQSALNHIKADEALINRTEIYLREKLAENEEPKVIEFTRKRFNPLKSFAKAACILFILTGGTTGAYACYKMPVAYLSLDINPSIELGVNAFNKVVSAEGYNEDGKTVLNGLNVTGANVEDAVTTVIKSAARNGFIDNDGKTVVSVTSETNNENIAEKLEQDAEDGVNDALTTEGKKAVIYKDNVALNSRMEARELNITPGKLNLINKLAEVNPKADENQYKTAKVREIIKAINDGSSDNTAVSDGKTISAASKDKNTVSSREEKSTINNREATVGNKAAVNKNNITSGSKDKNTAETISDNALDTEAIDRGNKDKENLSTDNKAVSDKSPQIIEESSNSKKGASDKKETKVKNRHK